MHNRASVEGILGPTEWFERVAPKTGTIMGSSAFISLDPHGVVWLYPLLNRAKPRYGGIITQSWLILSILDCGSKTDVTQSIEWLSIPRLMVWRMSGMIISFREMCFIFKKTPSDLPTAASSRYCVSSHLSVLSPQVASIILWKYTG